ncbi:methyltransferase-like protein 22 isoform X2 [Protopterus annectens]|uniref:methyltransferase-like protein 22 isoform X2 n=1 Tax=Protopterus annectens TaxID=7888 RepID=UPI001CF9D250|nr:methyltransferase-like protein 22 isoform X2 [Protopterus annectens]
MDVIRFTCDTVLSDVHLLMPNSQHFGEAECSGTASVPFKIQNSKDCDNFDGKESYQSKLVGGNRNESHDPSEEPVEVQNCKTTGDSEPCNESVEVTVVQNLDALLDEDGDLDLIRRPLDVSDTDQLEFYRLMVHPVILSKGEEGTREVEDQYDSYPDVIRIEHTMATPLEDVGKQVWRAALLLADYILHNHFIFKNCTALELGAGTGITSIAMATTAKTIYCTDVGDDLLNMCEKNVTLNRHLAEQMDPEFPYSWSEDEIASLHDDTTVLLAADVCYDSSLTDALFRTIYKIMSNLKNPSTLYISIEKRFNFTLRHMDITCEAYDHFRSCLNDLEHITDGKTKFTVESVPITFPQHLDYERFEHLELWKVTASPVST